MFKTPVIEGIKSVQSSQCKEWISSGKYTHIGKTEKLIIIITGTEISLDNGEWKNKVKVDSSLSMLLL